MEYTFDEISISSIYTELLYNSHLLKQLADIFFREDETEDIFSTIFLFEKRLEAIGFVREP